MKKQIWVCEVCEREECNGKVYEIKEKNQDEFYNNIILCENSEDVTKEGSKLYYHWVMGHGIQKDLELKPLEGKITYIDKYKRKFKKEIL